MKPKLAFPLIAFVTGTIAPSVIAASDPSIPVGKLTASPTAVQAGTYPTLNWEITYPSEIKSGQPESGGDSSSSDSGSSGSTGDSGSAGSTGDSGSAGSTATSDSGSTSSSSSSSSSSSDTVAAGYTTAPGQITLADDYYVKVQIVGAGVTTCANGGAASANSYPVDARMSVDGESYFQLFYGTPSEVNPSKVLYTKKLKQGQTLNFGGRYVVNDAWTSFYTTKSANQQIVSLVNGDIPPTTFALEKSATLASYLKPYLDGNGKVKLGALNALVMMELGQTDHMQSCFDHQDIVLLVTFVGKNNNGHGNNLDGVDSSNPGAGKGGPNGGVDPSNGVDDEAK
jgi:hypothetical protein